MQGGFCGGSVPGFLRRILRRARMRRKPGKKQVGADGKFNSGVPQACLGAAAAAPNPGIPILRRKREAKWPDSEKLLGNFWPLSRNDFLKLRRQPGKKQVGAAGKFNSGVAQACLAPLLRRQTQACNICAAREFNSRAPQACPAAASAAPNLQFTCSMQILHDTILSVTQSSV